MKKNVCFAVILMVYCIPILKAQAKLYPIPVGVVASKEYSVWVNNEPAFVYDSPIPAAYCSFDLSGPVDILIKVSRDVKWVDVRPLAAGIKPQFKDSTIHLKIAKPQKLSIEINGKLTYPLFLFANDIEKDKPSKNDPSIRYFEAGKVHYAGLIELSSNQSVYIEGGAVVVGAIKAINAKNIKISGRGILDGTYNHNFNDSLLKSPNPDTALLRMAKGKYQRFIELIRCENITIHDVTLHNNTTWQIVSLLCHNVNINNIKVVSDQPSDDGTDIVQSTKVTITNSFYRTKDDCIVLKAFLDTAAAKPIDGVLVKDCIFWNALWGNALEIGFELFAHEVKNIRFKNCDIIHVEAGAAISIHNAGTSHVHSVVFDNIRIEDARHKLFDFAIFRSQYSKDGTRDPEERRKFYLNGAWDGVLMIPTNKKQDHAQFRGKISRVTLSNISVEGIFPFSIFYGYDAEHAIQNIEVRNLKNNGKKITSIAEAKFYQEETKGLVLQ